MPQIDVLADSRRLPSYSYFADLFWTPPSGAWDPLYVEGRYRYDGVEFAPRDWLAKAATADPKFKAKLAAVDFVAAKNDAEPGLRSSCFLYPVLALILKAGI